MSNYDHYGTCFECGLLTGLNKNSLMCETHDYEKKIKELEAKLASVNQDRFNLDEANIVLNKKLAIAVEALCHLENATDSHSVQRNDEWNKLINEALEKIKQ